MLKTPISLEANDQTGALRFRDWQVVERLTIGAMLFGQSQNREGDVSSPSVSDVYETVRLTLQHSSIQSVEASYDPLTLFMVQRANVYSASCCGDPLRTTQSRHVTRREIAELGNTRGRIVQELIEALLASDVGFEKFKTLGTSRKLDDRLEWPTRDTKTLADLLLGWSPKQVRTHFERLLAQGIITGFRSSNNQPWVYALPESLADAASPFRSLPKNVLARQAPAARVCPEEGADRTSERCETSNICEAVRPSDPEIGEQ